MPVVPIFREIDRALLPDLGVIISIHAGVETIECGVVARRLAADAWMENAPLSINEAVEWARDRAMMFNFDDILIKLDQPRLWQPEWGPLAQK